MREDRFFSLLPWFGVNVTIEDDVLRVRTRHPLPPEMLDGIKEHERILRCNVRVVEAGQRFLKAILQ
jgi:hypothetical protein